MKTILNILLTTQDCKMIHKDLEKVHKQSGLNTETYLLLNKIYGFITSYDYIEK